MGFLCCICHEDFLTRKEKTKVELDETKNEKVPERPIVTTKCGHLFHSDCLRSWFGQEKVWTKKECPTCRMSLTVATDLIRIFTTSADDGGPSIEDFKMHISKLENANTVLSNNLEISFIRGRDHEKKIVHMTRDLDKVQKAYVMEKSKVSQFQSEAVKLKNENEELKNVIINLNKAMTSGNNGINLGGVQYHHAIPTEGQSVVLPMFPYNVGQSGNMQHSQGGGGNMNMFSNGHGTMTINQSSGLHHQQQQISSWSPSIKASDNIAEQVNEATTNGANHDSLNQFGFMNVSQNQHTYNNSQNKADSLTQLNTMFQDIMGNFYGDREKKSSSTEENNSSSCLDSDSSRTDSETGDHSTKIHKFGSSNHNDGINISSDSNGNSMNSYTPSTNNNSGLTTILVDQTPTDEMMDAILNSKSQPTTATTNDDFFVQKKFPLSTAPSSRTSKGKTKWKAYEVANEDKKMYGKFACKKCLSKWGTSRHVFNQAQTCLRCNEVVFPYDQGPVMTKEELAQQKLARSRKLQ